MKVRVSFSVDVDPELWAYTYGVEGAAEIRTDVQKYSEQIVRSHFEEVGVLA